MMRKDKDNAVGNSIAVVAKEPSQCVYIAGINIGVGWDVEAERGGGGYSIPRD